jgi:hypothetical protein
MLHGRKGMGGGSQRCGSSPVGGMVANPEHRTRAGDPGADCLGQAPLARASMRCRNGSRLPSGRSFCGGDVMRVMALDSLRNRPRAGRLRRITAAREQAVVSATLRKPKTATHWSVRRLAKEVRLSSATVHRIWQKYGLQPHAGPTRDPPPTA